MNQSSSANQPKIFVGGGSWARGEWEAGKPKVSHRGLIQYFIDHGYEVIDSSLARKWHEKSIQSLAHDLEKHYKENDVVFFMLADPLLDVVMPALENVQLKRNNTVENLQTFTDDIKRAGGVINLLRQTQDQIYQQLDAVAKQFNITNE